MAIESNILVIINEDEVSLILQAQSRIICVRKIAAGTKAIDRAVIVFFKKEWNLLIGNRTARSLWTELLRDPQSTFRVRARHLSNPREVFITDEQVTDAIREIVKDIANGVQEMSKDAALETKPDLWLRGEEKLERVARILSQETSLSVSV